MDKKTPAAPEPVPTAEYPIAPVYRGRRGIYDLVFGGKDGSGRKRLCADENTLVIAWPLDFRLAAVLRKTPDHKAARLSFYDHDGREVKSVKLKDALLHHAAYSRQVFPYYRMWVGTRREAILEARIPQIEEVVGVILFPGKRKVHWVKPDGTIRELKDFPGIDQLWFTASDGFVVISIEEGSKRRLTRYSGEGGVLWAKRLSNPSLVPTEKGYDFSIRLGSYRVHFRRGGTFDGVKIPYDASAFHKANPGYVEGTGRFYEEKYLPTALEQLARAASLSKEEKTATEDHLKAFIYEYLDARVRLGPEEGILGEMPNVLARLDGRFRALLDEERFARYQAWRNAFGPRTNALGFLFMQGKRKPVSLDDMIGPVEIERGSSRPTSGQEPREKDPPQAK